MSAELEEKTESELNSLNDASQDELAALSAQLDKDEAELPADLKASRPQEPASDEDESPLEAKKSPEPPKVAGNQNAEKPEQTPPKGQDKQPDPQKQPETKPLSKYEEAKKKAAEREAKAWQKIDAEKQELARQKAELEAARRQVTQPPAQAPKADVDPMENPDALDQAAKKFEDEGKFDLADLARERAAELRKNPPAAKAPAAQAPAPAIGKNVFEMQPHEITLSGMPKGEVNRLQNELYKQAAQEMPEVLKQGTELNTKFLDLARQNPEAFHFPKGPYMLARMVKLEADASRLPVMSKELEAKNTEITTLQKRIKELEQLTSPGAGDLTDPTLSEKTFEQMSLEQQERELDRLAGRS